jgi:hypothetical protein
MVVLLNLGRRCDDDSVLDRKCCAIFGFAAKCTAISEHFGSFPSLKENIMALEVDRGQGSSGMQ